MTNIKECYDKNAQMLITENDIIQKMCVFPNEKGKRLTIKRIGKNIYIKRYIFIK